MTEPAMTVEKLVALQRKTLAHLIDYTQKRAPLLTGDAFDPSWLDWALRLGVCEVRFVYNGDGRWGAVADFDKEHWVSLVGHGSSPLVALQNALLDAQATRDRP